MRKTDDWLKLKLVLIAAALVTAQQASACLAQVPRFAMKPEKNAATQPEAPAGKQGSTTQAADPVQELLDRAIEITSKRYMTTHHSPWQIFHGILAMRQETQLKLGKEKVNAIQWITTTEPTFDNEPWLLLTPHGAKFHPYTRKWAFEGHPAQFLALLTHSNLPTDYPIHVQGKVVTLNDLINNTMKEVNTNEEVTWVLWALQHYLSPDATWTNQANENWSIERLVQIESAAPVVNTPCGGNHRLFALTRARDKYLRSGGKLRGVWWQADQKIKQHIEIAKSLQNSDGAFSAKFYAGPMSTTDVNERFNTTGHTMEFLSIALPDNRLHENWVRNAVWMLSRELIIYRDTPIDAGPLFHSLDALILYRDRIRPQVPSLDQSVPVPQVANVPPTAPPTENLKSTADPVVKPPNQIATPEPSVASQTPSATTPTELKPAELKPAEPKPAEPKPVILDAQPVPEQKSDALAPEKTIETSQKPIRMEFKKSRTSLSNQDIPASRLIPKLDPALLSNVGQAAPPEFTAKSGKESGRQGRGAPKAIAPELLPDAQATPLTNAELSFDKSASNGLANKSPKVTESGVEPSAKDLAALIPPIISEPLSVDAPMSALEPANAHAGDE